MDDFPLDANTWIAGEVSIAQGPDWALSMTDASSENSSHGRLWICHLRLPESTWIVRVKNKGALRGTEGRLLRMGPESGIVDGESPSISLSYIDKAGYKRTNTCAYMVSTESVCQQLGSCLVACYLFPTVRTYHIAWERSKISL